MYTLFKRIELMYFTFYSKYQKILWFLYLILWIYLSYRSYLLAVDSSLDMQWYPTLHFWGLGKFNEAINPFYAFLQGDFFMANTPNYMPLMYYIMFPFGLFEWGEAKQYFALFNLFCFLVTILICFCKTRSREYFFLFSCFVILGYTYGNVIGNAQSTIFIGMWIVVAYYFRTNPILLTMSLTFILVKHSVGIPIVLGFFLAGYKREVIYTCMIVMLIISISALKFCINPIDFIKMMLQVNANTYTSLTSLGGPGDIISLSQKIFHKPYSIISCLDLMVYVMFIFMVLKNRPSEHWIISASIVLSLVSLPHLGYDYYLLFIALLLMIDGTRMNFGIILTLFVSLFLWRCYFVKKWIDILSRQIIDMNEVETHWAMNMGVPFCIFLIICFVVIIFSCLSQKK